MQQRIRKKDRIGVHGHRGARGTHPENTMAGFKEALRCGADYFEVDIHLTSDDVPIVFHDPVISPRVCKDRKGQPVRELLAVRELSLSELKKFDCGSTTQVAFPRQELCPGETIPSLEEVCQWLTKEGQGIMINVEIKREATSDSLLPDPHLLAEKTLQVIGKYHLAERCLIQSFDHQVVAQAKKIKKDLLTSCLFEDDADFVTVALKHGAKAIGPHFKLLSGAIIKQCHEAGLEVLPWTVNEPSDWHTLIAMGVDGIITDYPRDLLQVLRG